MRRNLLVFAALALILGGSAPVSSPATAETAATGADMDVPYISELEVNPADPNQRLAGWDNCGPASLAMAMAYASGKTFSDDAAARAYMHTIVENIRGDGNLYVGGFTDLDQWEAALNQEGYQYNVLTDWSSVATSLDNRQPVVVAVENNDFDSAPYPSDASWMPNVGGTNHVVVVTGYDDASVSINDPLADPYYVSAGSGKNWKIGKASFLQAMDPDASGSVTAIVVNSTAAPPPPPPVVPTSAPAPTAPPLPQPGPAPQPVLVSGTVLYAADWSGGLNGWQGPSDWHAVSGMLMSDGSGTYTHMLAPFHPPSDDYAVEAEMQLDGPDLGVFVRYSGTGSPTTAGCGNCRVTYMGGIDNFGTMSRIQRGDQVLVDTPFTPGKAWHTYRIEARGTLIRLLIDGHVMVQTTDSTYPTGRGVGVHQGHYARVSVRAFRVVVL